MNNPMKVNGAFVPTELGRPVQVDEDRFNLCTECGTVLIENEDGFGTNHGTCYCCVRDWEAND